MNIVTLDFETYYDDDYTLKKLTTEEYVRDPRFEVLGIGIRWPDGESTWFHGDNLPVAFFNRYKLTDCAILCHHAQFDGLILSHHYGVRPRLWLDTLSMARMVVGTHLPLGLDALAAHYGLAGKTVPYKAFKGRRWQDLAPDARQALADGCLHDVALTYSLFAMLMHSFPDEELLVVDATIRMFTESVLEGDISLLADIWMDEERRKRDSLEALGVAAADLQSSEAFAGLLREAGVEPATKASPTGNGSIYAFAKTDDFMKELADEDSRAGALARARLGVRSTITQTRAERLGFMASRGQLPVYLRYHGAHTSRWAGGDSLNWQNFPRRGSLRQSIKAPANRCLIVLDLAQVECRVLNALAGEWDVVEAFAAGRDLYAEGASRFYGRTITRADKAERHLGKVLELGCGYGMGCDKLRVTCRGGALGGPPIELDADEAQHAIHTYRAHHPRVVAYWRRADWVIDGLANRDLAEDWGPMHVEKDGRLYLPNGGWLDYTTLEWDQDWRAYKLRVRNGWTKLYGGKLVENVVQALSRVILSQAMLRIVKKGYKIATCTHDELVVVVPKDGSEQAAYADCLAEMEQTPAWLPGLPVKAEGGISERYEK